MPSIMSVTILPYPSWETKYRSCGNQTLARLPASKHSINSTVVLSLSFVTCTTVDPMSGRSLAKSSYKFNIIPYFFHRSGVQRLPARKASIPEFSSANQIRRPSTAAATTTSSTAWPTTTTTTAKLMSVKTWPPKSKPWSIWPRTHLPSIRGNIFKH